MANNLSRLLMLDNHRAAIITQEYDSDGRYRADPLDGQPHGPFIGNIVETCFQIDWNRTGFLNATNRQSVGRYLPLLIVSKFSGLGTAVSTVFRSVNR